MNNQNITRRAFLKGVGAGGMALTATWLFDGAVDPAYASSVPNPHAWGMLIDLTRCVGCDSCVLACQRTNNLPLTTTIPHELDSDVYTCLQTHQLAARTLYVKRQCMHCNDPACVSVCTVGALKKTSEGPVVYDAEKCIGCRYCQYACPFGVPTYDWNDPFGLIHKCQFCFARMQEGEKPACVQACADGALHFDRREALLALAHAKIVSNPDRYVDHVYGEHEAGGTSMLYLSPVPFSELDFPTLDSEPIAHNAEAVMKRTPLIAMTVASAVTGLHWVIKRREGQPNQIQADSTDSGVEK